PGRGLLGRNGARALRDPAALGAEDGRAQERGVDAARLADREGSHRNASGHLHDGKQRVDAFQRRRLDRHAEHRQDGLRRRHSRQMCRPARSRDKHLEAARLGTAGILEEQIGRPVRGHDADLVRHTELIERLGSVPQGLPVRPGAHDDADQGVHWGFTGVSLDLPQPSMIIPPSTGITCPVTMRESSDASHTAVPVRSSGSSARWIAICMSMMYCRYCSGTPCFVASVMVGPGAMALTRMFCRPTVPAMKCVMALMAAFVTL